MPYLDDKQMKLRSNKTNIHETYQHLYLYVWAIYFINLNLIYNKLTRKALKHSLNTYFAYLLT